MLTAPSTGSTAALTPRQEQAVINTENKMLRTPRDKTEKTWKGNKIEASYFFSSKHSAPSPPRIYCKGLSRGKQEVITQGTCTHHFTVHEEGSSAQLGVALGKNRYCTGWLRSPECIPERSLLPCCIYILRWAGKNAVAGLLLLLQSKSQRGAVPRSPRGLIPCPKV